MFKIAILQKRAINAQIDKNIESIIMAMKEAAENHADILLLPECFVTGYNLPMSYEKSIADDDIRIAIICENAKNIKLVWYSLHLQKVISNHKTQLLLLISRAIY